MEQNGAHLFPTHLKHNEMCSWKNAAYIWFLAQAQGFSLQKGWTKTTPLSVSVQKELLPFPFSSHLASTVLLPLGLPTPPNS